MVRTDHFHSLGVGSVSGRRAKIPQLHRVVRGEKRKKKIKATRSVILKIG